MIRWQSLPGPILLLAAVLTCTPASAFFHLWSFSEIFSSADGSVQFFELETQSNNEHFAIGAEIRSLATGNVFTFPANLSSSNTANKRLLVATEGFGALPGGVSPDFTLPSTDFFDPTGDTVTLFAGTTIDSRTFSTVPTDGVMSRNYPSDTLAVNSPTNFSGASGSVDLSAPSLAGDYNDNGQVEQADLDLVLLNWGDSFDALPAEWVNQRPQTGIVDQAELDGALLNWGNAAARTAAVPEPATWLAAVLAGLAAVAVRSRRQRPVPR